MPQTHKVLWKRYVYCSVIGHVGFCKAFEVCGFHCAEKWHLCLECGQVITVGVNLAALFSEEYVTIVMILVNSCI